MSNSTLSTSNGMIVFNDGTVVYIDAQQYSPDGINNWEDTFNPYTHISTNDGVTIIDGHRYKRVKHSGDTTWQLPYRIIPDKPIYRIENGYLQNKLEHESSDEWVNILELASITGKDGNKGDQGISGEGFNIDIYGYYTSRPACTNSLSTSSCTTCNNTSTATNNAITFMSLGDGTLILTQALISVGTVTVDTVAYTHFSNDLVNWNAISSGIVDFQARYLATNSTGSVYTDMRTENYYGTQGLVYVCADGTWVLFTNIATPSYMVGESSGSTNIGFLDHFVNVLASSFLDDTIGIEDGKLKIIQESINATAFADGTFGDGISHTAPNLPTINPNDFSGFGLSTYISNTDSNPDIQVDITVLIGNGLNSETTLSVDGELRNIAILNLTDIISNDSGLITFDPGDGYNDLQVNLGNGLLLDGGTPQAITIDVDDLSLIVDAASIRIKPYTTGNDGVMRGHLNPNIIWTGRGLALDTANGLYARIDNTTIGYDGSGNLEVPLNSITGTRLNDNVANNLMGIEVNNDALILRVDGSTIGFNPSGQLTYLGIVEDVVTSISAGGVTIDGDIVYTITSPNGSIDFNIVGNAIAGTINVALDIDDSYLANYLTINPPVGTPTAWGDLTGTLTNQTDLVAYITGRNFSVLNTWYGNAQLNSTHGLVLKDAGSGNTFKVGLDANGNLNTVAVTL